MIREAKKIILKKYKKGEISECYKNASLDGLDDLDSSLQREYAETILNPHVLKLSSRAFEAMHKKNKILNDEQRIKIIFIANSLNPYQFNAYIDELENIPDDDITYEKWKGVLDNVTNDDSCAWWWT